jgi:hypothetical protein
MEGEQVKRPVSASRLSQPYQAILCSHHEFGPFLGPPGAREGSSGGWRDPERIDDPPVLETPLGTGSATQVLGDAEASRRLGRSEETVVNSFIENSRLTAADHRLTKLLVPA